MFNLKEKKISRNWINFIFLVVETLLQIHFKFWSLAYFVIKGVYTIVYYSKPEV